MTAVFPRLKSGAIRRYAATFHLRGNVGAGCSRRRTVADLSARCPRFQSGEHKTLLKIPLARASRRQIHRFAVGDLESLAV